MLKPFFYFIFHGELATYMWRVTGFLDVAAVLNYRLAGQVGVTCRHL